MTTTPDPIDVHVGARLRQAREKAGMSQTALAATAGVSFQQVQKYERGMNRISASVLWCFCRGLELEPNFFFDGLGVQHG